MHANIWLASRSRPKNVDEIAHQEEVVATLRRALETANVSCVRFHMRLQPLSGCMSVAVNQHALAVPG